MAENSSVETLLEQGHNLLDRGQEKAALEIFQQAATLEPQNHKVLYALGLALYRLESYQNSIEHLTQALEIQPSYILALARRGMAYKELDRVEAAEADFETAIQIQPLNHEDYRGRGIAFDELKRYEDAIADYNQALILKPDDSNTYLNRGYAFNNLGRYEDAIADLDQALILKPDYYLAYNNRGYAFNKLKRYEDAIADYNQALILKPDYWEAYTNRGYAFNELKQYEDAIADLDQALRLKPDCWEAYTNRGCAFSNLGRYEDAIADLDQALILKPDYYLAYNNRGDAFNNLGQYENAIADLDQALILKPDYYLAYNNRGYAFNELKQYEDAIADLDQALRLKLDSHYAYNNRGYAFSNLGRYEDAIADLDQALILKPDYWQAWRHLGNTYYWQGWQQESPFSNWLQAKFAYEQALKYLNKPELRQIYLEVLQELIRVCQYLMPANKVEELWRQGTDILDGWLKEDELSLGKKIKLRREFAQFNQIRVDSLAQSNKVIEALQLAEQRKNTCLNWLREKTWRDANTLPYSRMQQLLKPGTAVIYWHISDAAITTFIIKHGQAPIVLKPAITSQSPQILQQPGETFFYQNTQRLKRFENWIREWKQDYQDYREGNYTSLSKEEAPWRLRMDYKLLNQLRDILEINRINREYLKNIDELILIPHRDLHLLPLDCLFPQKFSITYLPSFQIGLDLQLSVVENKNQEISFLNVENPRKDLPFATIESVILASLYQQYHQIDVPLGTTAALIQSLKQNTGYFHFTGHADHQPEQPRDSALMLAEPEQLTLGNIFDDENLNFNRYQLICLSACETGITSKVTLLDEYVGFVSGFLAKGAKCVLSTLWTVDERSTALLMIEFYQLLQQGKTLAEALRNAKYWLSSLTYQELAQWYRYLAKDLQNPHCRAYLETEALIIERDKNKIASPEPLYKHPYYWAGFILTGNPY
jgi:CHAT domain-containing protein/tetratricopeptide (TPR) repeat protein